MTIANVNRGKNVRPFKPGDFMPEFDSAPRIPQTAEDIARVMDQMVAIQRGRGITA